MEARDKLIAAGNNKDPLERQMTVAALIASELEKKGTKVVLVGGSAVEFYTAANYLTRDIDFIATSPDNIKEVMTDLGFKNEGGTWFLSGNPNIVVEFPKGPLDGDWNKVQNVTLPDGTNVNIIGIEDIIIDRACAVKYWNDPEEWINYLMVGNFEHIDWDYLNKRSLETGCSDIISKSKEWAKKQRECFLNENL